MPNLKDSFKDNLRAGVSSIMSQCFSEVFTIKINFYCLSFQPDSMSPEAFAKFLMVEQKEVMSLEDASNIIKNFESSENKNAFTMEGFTHFLMFNEWTEVVSPMARNKSSIKDEYMRHPLSHYWIASSHNT